MFEFVVYYGYHSYEGIDEQRMSRYSNLFTAIKKVKWLKQFTLHSRELYVVKKGDYKPIIYLLKK